VKSKIKIMTAYALFLIGLLMFLSAVTNAVCSMTEVSQLANLPISFFIKTYLRNLFCNLALPTFICCFGLFIVRARYNLKKRKAITALTGISGMWALSIVLYISYLFLIK
jgi:hypothetical protein